MAILKQSKNKSLSEAVSTKTIHAATDTLQSSQNESTGLREHLITEAVSRIKLSKYRDKELLEYIQKISSEMELSEDEEAEVVEKATDGTKKTDDMPNTIWFSSEEELDEAVGLLMYAKIPWEAKGEDEDFFYIEFSNADILTKAHKILKNKWNLVDETQRAVGVIQFDNLSDYMKVLDFIKKQDMIVQFGANIAQLGEDYDLEVSADPKNPKKATLENHEGSYVAISNKHLFEHEAEPYTSKQDRMASVRKIWN